MDGEQIAERYMRAGGTEIPQYHHCYEKVPECRKMMESAIRCSANGIFLRFPGQWDHEIWHAATTGTELYYNLYRWYETRTGRYTRADPLGVQADLNVFRYALARPTDLIDPLGLDTVGCDLPPGLKPVVENSCTLRCCAEHDACYDRWNCSGKSWLGPDGCHPVRCAACNDKVVRCFAKCTSLPGILGAVTDRGPERHYCAKQGRYVTVPGDFANREEAERECEMTHPQGNCCWRPGPPCTKIFGDTICR